MNPAAPDREAADGVTAGARPGTVGEVLRWGRTFLRPAAGGSADLEAQVILSDALGVDRWRLFSDFGREVEEGQWRACRDAFRRRAGGEPLAYLRGRKEFWSLDLSVGAGALVPRPETEGVVEAALENLGKKARIADVGTGSGNIIAAVGKELEESRWLGIDISSAALEVARTNIAAHGLEDRVDFVLSDLFRSVRADRALFDGVLSNPPYVRTADLASLPREVRRHEPRVALDGGADGLAVIRRLLAEAPRRIRRGGVLILEVGAGQAPAVIREARRTGFFEDVRARRDLAGIERVVVARRN